VSIGTSGEKLVLTACIMNDKERAAGRSGLGAVMGSKKLKAVVVQGTMDVPMADEARIREVRRNYLKNPEGFYQILGERFRDRILMVVARRDGEVIASAFNVFKDDMLYGRYWGCAEDIPFLHFEVCYYHPIDECIRRGIRRFSPGAGGGYKYLRAFEPELEHSAHRVYEPRFASLVAHALQEERREVEGQRQELLARSALKRNPDGTPRT